MRVPFISALVGAALLADAANAEQSISLQDQTIFANLIAGEFNAVCIKNDADIDGVAAAAARRKWKARPVEIGGHRRMPSKAWEGKVSHYSYAGRRGRAAFPFAIGVGEVAGERWCEFVLPEIPFATLREAAANQGFSLHYENAFVNTEYEWRWATYCVPRLVREGRAHVVEVSFRRVDKSPWWNGLRLVFVRKTAPGESLCPIGLYIGTADGPVPPEPAIEPWLGQKQPKPTAQPD